MSRSKALLLGYQFDRNDLGDPVEFLRGDSLSHEQLLTLAIQELGKGLGQAHRSFLDAMCRVDRAREHLANLETRVETFAEGQKSKVYVEAHGEGRFARIVDEGLEPPPRDFSVVIGEIIYNLRAALDYLVYALAWLDSGEHQAKTQFPIENRRDSFKGRRRSFLKGVSEKHVAAIERLQPFEGCDWTRQLRDFSNRDKHWALNLTVVQGSGWAHFHYEEEEAEAPSERKVDVENVPTTDVAFEEGPPVVKTLRGLESEVRALLELFQPEFERRYQIRVGGGMAIKLGPREAP